MKKNAGEKKEKVFLTLKKRKKRALEPL